MDPCFTIKNQVDCVAKDCTWNANNTCTWNECVRLNNETTCYTARNCYMHPSSHCAMSPCTGLDQTACALTDCHWEGGTCVYHPCVRLHANDMSCYILNGTLANPGCVMSQANKCEPNPCIGTSPSACKDECYFASGACVYHRCVRLYTTDTTCYPNCHMDTTNKCYPDPCMDITDATNCAGPSSSYDCVWDPSITTARKCVYNRCVRLHGKSEMCTAYGDCHLDSKGICTPDPCTGLSAADCGKTDCTVEAGVCTWQNCTRMHMLVNTTTPTETCAEYNNVGRDLQCVLDPYGHCFPDPCFHKGPLGQSNCPADCTWNSAKPSTQDYCSINSCVRLHNEPNCSEYENCIMVAGPPAKCALDPCTEHTSDTDCVTGCVWDSLASRCYGDECTRGAGVVACPAGCIHDADPNIDLCFPNVCPAKSEGACNSSDCTWNYGNSMCEWTPCVRLHNQTTCPTGFADCQMDPNGRCTADPCIALSAAACTAAECTWSGGSCSWNRCTRLHGEPNCYADCYRVPGSTRCLQDPCLNLNEAACADTDCVWDTSIVAMGKCQYHRCVRLVAGTSVCYDGCRKDAFDKCVADPCLVHTDEGSCNRTECTWVPTPGTGHCEWNKCVRLHEENYCPMGCVEDTRNLCVLDPCDSVTAENTCKSRSCTFNASAPVVCYVNRCTPLHNESDCSFYSGCYRDPNNNGTGNAPICIENPCPAKSQSQCLKSDCTWDGVGGECVWNRCVRLRGETACYSDCYKNSRDVCVEDPCMELYNEANCTATDCVWQQPAGGGASKCTYHDCVRLPGEVNCPLGCQFDRLDKCAKDFCPDQITPSLCTSKDCTYNAMSSPQCSWNTCVRMHNEGTCYIGCQMLNGMCVFDPCADVTSRTLCESKDCTWTGSEATGNCTYNSCVRLGNNTNTTTCPSGCRLKPTTNTCVPDICNDTTLSQTACVALDCNWTANTCVYHPCVRLGNETECYAGCVKNSALTCQADRCLTVTDETQCGLIPECIWLLNDWTDPQSGSCRYNRCFLYPNTTCTTDGKCQVDANGKCVPDVCADATTEASCFQDCTWAVGRNTCTWNSCVRLHYGSVCPADCAKHPLVGKCLADPCYTITSQPACESTDCAWQVGAGTCAYHNCVRLGGDTACYDGCYEDYGRCISLSCGSYNSKTSCNAFEACVWNPKNSTCELNDCMTHMNTDRTCQAGFNCQLDARNVCVVDKCRSQFTLTDCLDYEECVWNAVIGSCDYNPCVTKKEPTGTCAADSGCNLNDRKVCVSEACSTLLTFSACDNAPLCLWNITEVPAPVCKYNPCISRNDGLGNCSAGCIHGDKRDGGNQVCAPDVCSSYSTNVSLCHTAVECVWVPHTSVCEYNPCVAFRNPTNSNNPTTMCADASSITSCTPAVKGGIKDVCVPTSRCVSYAADYGACLNATDCVWEPVNGTCMSNACATRHDATNWTCLSNSTLPCAVGTVPLVCVPNFCGNYTTRALCENATICMWNYSTNTCKYDVCTPQYLAAATTGGIPTTGSCANISPESGCQLSVKGSGSINEHDVCVPSSTCSSYSKNATACINAPECVYNYFTSSCQINTCVSKFNATTGGCKGSAGECIRDINLVCTTSLCSIYIDKATCVRANDCLWNPALKLCEINTCMLQHESDGTCVLGSGCVFNPNKVCIPDRCIQFGTSRENCLDAPDCMWDYALETCVYNPCASQVADNGTCSTGCTPTDVANVCIPDVCTTYSKDACNKAVECIWNLTNPGCSKNACIQRYNASNGTCTAASSFLGCWRTSKDGIRNICSINNTCDTYIGNRSLCEESTDCFYNATTSSCRYNPCAVQHDAQGNCLNIFANKTSSTEPVVQTYCNLGSSRKVCTVQACDAQTTESACNGFGPECFWNTTASACAYNPCVGAKAADGTSCIVGSGCEYSTARNGVCIPDSCGGKDQTTCVGECMWTYNNKTPGGGGRCGLNPCVQQSQCPNPDQSCVTDATSVCVPNVCQQFNTSVSDCVKHDCTWTGADCLYNSCVRLHNEDSCYPGCQMDQNGVCAHDICADATSQTDCDRTDCEWDSIADTCVYHSCVRLHGEATCFGGCLLDPAGKCAINPCYGKTTKEDCFKDCVWYEAGVLAPTSPAICMQTRCTRLHGVEEACYANCEKDPNDACTEDPCYQAQSSHACPADCKWTGSSCEYHECVRLHGEHQCYSGCAMFHGQRCVRDPCQDYGILCPEECLYDVAGGKCLAQPCTRLEGEACAPLCEMVGGAGGYCVPQVCGDTISGRCESYVDGCKHNPANDRECIRDRCSLHTTNATCANAFLGEGGPCSFIDGRCESSSECTIAANVSACRTGCYANVSSATFKCIPDPCASASTDQECSYLRNSFAAYACALVTFSLTHPCHASNICNSSRPNVCADVCDRDLSDFCHYNECPNLHTPSACYRNELCTMIGSSCVWNDCLRKTNNKCETGCVVNETRNNTCVPDSCRVFGNGSGCAVVENCHIGKDSAGIDVCYFDPTVEAIPPPVQAAEKPFPWWIIVIVVVVVVALGVAAAVIIIIFLMRHKSSVGFTGEYFDKPDIEVKEGEGMGVSIDFLDAEEEGNVQANYAATADGVDIPKAEGGGKGGGKTGLKKKKEQSSMVSLSEFGISLDDVKRGGGDDSMSVDEDERLPISVSKDNLAFGGLTLSKLLMDPLEQGGKKKKKKTTKLPSSQASLEKKKAAEATTTSRKSLEKKALPLSKEDDSNGGAKKLKKSNSRTATTLQIPIEGGTVKKHAKSRLGKSTAKLDGMDDK